MTTDENFQGRLTPVQVQSLLEARADEQLILLDVRNPLELKMYGYIDGAMFMPLDQINRRYTELAPDDQIIVYCQHGVRSLAVVQALRQAGYLHVTDLEGGIDMWQRSGLPVKRDYGV
jgi:rhodanese-related sulfurtransferase